MNWLSHTTGSVPKDAVTLPVPEFSDPIPEAAAQHDAAVKAALLLLPFVGADGDPVQVTVAGYAYAGHAPNGEPNEVITITVAARPEDKPAPVEEPPAEAPAVPFSGDMPPAIDAETPFPPATVEEPSA